LRVDAVRREGPVAENAITPFLPHGKARLGTVAGTLWASSRTLLGGWRRKV
jgi:hypothetical protein